VTAPDDLCTGARHRGGESGGLRVVNQDDVLRTNEREQLFGVVA
jgi:hypothetical protein